MVSYSFVVFAVQWPLVSSFLVLWAIPILYPFQWLSTCMHTGYQIIQSLFYTESPADYVAVDQVLTFAACESQRCVNVSLANDLVSEPEETFSLSLTRSTRSHISITSATGVVVITDDDGKKYLSITTFMSLCSLFSFTCHFFCNFPSVLLSLSHVFFVLLSKRQFLC